jgi:hypothetical protein
MILLINFGLDPMTIQADIEGVLVKLLRADNLVSCVVIPNELRLELRV